MHRLNGFKNTALGVGNAGEPASLAKRKRASGTPGRLISYLCAGSVLALGGLAALGCGKENTVNAGSPICQAGELRCKSSAIEVCKEDGSGFELQEVCSGEMPYCAAGTCVACEVGSQYCSGNMLYGRCQHESDTEIAVQDCSAVNQICSEGRCKVPSCEPASVSCEGNTVITCAADGLGISKREPCTGSQRCFDGACESWLCKPGRHCTSEKQVEICSEDGRTVLESIVCGAAEGCEEGECKPRACMPGETFCSDGQRLVCNQTGVGAQPWPCGAEQSCINDDQCANWVCEPNTDYCAGNERRRCSLDGLKYEVLSPCSGETSCFEGSCEPWVCEAGSSFCEGRQPLSCAADGLSSAALEPECGGETSCVSGQCTPWVCAPLARKCSGNQPQICADNRTKYEDSGAHCAGGKLCDAGLCKDYEGYARWPLPGTDGHPFSYSQNTAQKTVKDNVTGLLWQREVAPGTYTWQEAIDYCDELSWGGRDDWRLPTRMELISIVDYTKSNPAIDSVVFPGTPSVAFWTGGARSGSGQGWYVRFDSGYALVDITNKRFAVRCVAEAEAQKPIPTSGHFFEVTPNGLTVLDTATGLEWQRGTSPTQQSQASQISYCNAESSPHFSA